MNKFWLRFLAVVFGLSFTLFLSSCGGGGSSSYVHPLEPVVTSAGFFSVCDRTPAVRDAIMSKFSSISDCSFVYQINLDSITQLTVRGKGIRSFLSRDFDNLVNLEDLYIDNNPFTELPGGIFSDLESLDTLVMDHNHMETIPTGTFSDLPHLNRLWIGQTKLTHLPEDVFNDLPNLEGLYIQNSRLTTLPRQIFANNTNLVTLWMSNNQFSQLPSEIFSNLSNLEVLALCCNNLRELPAELFSGNPSLVEISLERNPISALDPGIFSGLSRLKTLDLHWLSLSVVPDSIYELTSLEVLNMENNRVSEIGEFTNLTELREIDLRHNRIDELPPRFLHGLLGIEKLFLSGNPGAPFAVPLILDRTDESDLSSSPASVAIKLHDTAIFDTMPFDLEVTVEAQRGDISESTITIPAEEQSSTEFTVTQESSEKATYVYVTSTGRLPLLISGLEFQSSAPLVLFVETSNQMPQAVGRIRPHVLTVNQPLNLHYQASSGLVEEVDVSSYFTDEDSDTLTYEAYSSEEAVLDVSLSGTRLNLSPRAPGSVLIELRGTDEDGIYAKHEFGVTVKPEPDPNAFNIDLVFLTDATDGQRSATEQAAERWSKVIISELSDVDYSGSPITGECLSTPTTPIFGDVLDDLRVYVNYGANQPRGGPRTIREDSGFPSSGCIWLSIYSDHGDTEEEADEKDHWTTIHEIAHVLGFGTLWNRHGFLQEITTSSNLGEADTHFTGPLAIEAFDTAGGDQYALGKKVPVSNSSAPSANSHWRAGWSAFRDGVVIFRDTMGGAGWSDTSGVLDYQSVLSAITIQSLADLGYEVDVSQADEFTVTPAPPNSMAVGITTALAEELDCTIHEPIHIIDAQGTTVRVLGKNHWDSSP